MTERMSGDDVKDDAYWKDYRNQLAKRLRAGLEDWESGIYSQGYDDGFKAGSSGKVGGKHNE